MVQYARRHIKKIVFILITIKSEREIELMRHAGMLVSKMHQFIKPYIKEGITTKELEQLNLDMYYELNNGCLKRFDR